MSKQKHLVIQHLENLSWEILEEYPDVIKILIKGKAGIYALYRREKLYYVGLASNLMNRLKIHLKDRHKGLWDRFSVYLTVHNDHIKELESLILKISNPSGNKVGGKFARSVNLRSDLSNRIKDKDDDRRALLMGGQFVELRRRNKMKKEKGVVNFVGLFEKRIRLKAAYKKKEYIATLRKDGLIGYEGKQYQSPTAVAKIITGRAINGWYFWKYKNSKGLWVRLIELRK